MRILSLILLATIYANCVLADPIAEHRIKRIDDAYHQAIRAVNEDAVHQYERLLKELSGNCPRAADTKARINALKREMERSDTSREPAPDYPAGTVIFSGHHYFQFTNPMTWADPVAACAARSGHLIALDNQPEYDHVHSHISKTGQPVWLDFSDTRQEATWLNWQSRPAFQKWQSGEPNDGRKQNYVMLGLNGSWYMRDVDSVEKCYVICEWDQ